MNDKGRALGRGGGGAVFGSKNLVAIVVAGSVPVEVAAPEALRPTNIAGSAYKAHVKLRLGKLTKPPEQFGILSSMGTAGLLGMLSQYYELIHCNFRDTRHVTEQIERIGGEALASHPAIKVRRRAWPGLGFGAAGGWSALALYSMVAGVALFLRWRHGAWRRIRLA